MEEGLKLSQLGLNECARIDSFSDEFLSLKLMEIGMLPGTEVKLIAVAPFGDPISVELESAIISLRKSEAGAVRIEKL